nr:UDP-2,3-diacylglucosamine diphosphatase LpxI [Palleronia sp. THAF1]
MQADPQAHVAGLQGFAPDGAESFRLEHLGSFLAGLRARGTKRIVFAGSLRRPSIDPTAIDAATAPLVPRLAMAMRQGDDALLRAVISVFEEAGLSVIGPTDLIPDLLPAQGVLTRAEPDSDAQGDADRATALLRATGPADLGQGVVVASGQVLALEALPGTDWMLESVAALRGDGPLARPVPVGGLLMKRPKPGQDRRIDLPVIGPDTVRRAAAAGLHGIAIEAGGVMILDRAETVAAADDAELFLSVVP